MGGMIAWLLQPTAASRLALAGIALGVAGLIGWIIVSLGESALTTARDTGIDAGRAIERSETLDQTIANVEKANEAASELRHDPAVWCDQCLRDSRTPQACQFRVPGTEDYQLCAADAGPD